MAFKPIKSKKVDTSDNFTPFPEGIYDLEIKKADWMETNAGGSHYLKLEMNVVKGDHRGRKVWHLLNLDNPNAQTQEIAEKQVMQILQQAYGEKRDVESIDQLKKLVLGQVVRARVRIRHQADYPPNNQIGSFVMDSQAEAPTAGGKKKGKKDKKKSKKQGW